MKKRGINKFAIGMMSGAAGYVIVGTILHETLQQNVAAVIAFMIATVVVVLTKD